VNPIRPLIEQIHATPTKVVLAVTGGGSRALAELLEVPGASRTVLEATVPYAPEALTAWLGSEPEQFCAPATARAMAMAAYQRARRYAAASGDAGPLAGVGATASLATDRPKRGQHRIHVAIQTLASTAVRSLVFTTNQRPRGEEEQIASALILNAVAEACGVPQQLPLALAPDETVERAEAVAPQEWQALLAGQTRVAIVGPAPVEPPNRPGRAIFAGAFNPLHAGHRTMAQLAAERLGKPVEFEISIENVDKPLLDYLEMSGRAAQFSADQRLWFTRAATFLEKSAIFPAAWFIVGSDTIARLVEARYYGGDPEACQAALDEIARRGCRFLVFGRSQGAKFQTLSDLALPYVLRAICDEVPGDQFRVDISSTDLRQTS
jgi:nicotinamide mononucleotide (NMN) deamidase PncC